LTQGTLFVVATPIGNLSDLSPRARQVLAEADLVAAEDTRHTGRLLSHFGIETPQIALHEHNEREAVEALVAKLEQGESIALVSDAGTPLVSDPGYRLVLAAHRAGIRVSPLPGPSAVIAALSAAGLPTDRFCFEGFLPPRARARRDRLEALRFELRTMVFYVPVHRVSEDLAACIETFGAAREAFVGRELSKLHEQCVAAPLGDLQAMIAEGRLAEKGELVLVVAGGSGEGQKQRPLDEDRLLQELAAVLPGKQAVAIAAAVSGQSRNALYRKMLALTRPADDDGG
jgi:16S rRNA (cytidine1402-2'-O)-methyltransferase